MRGRVDLIINGSYWLGSAAGSAVALLFLDTAIFPKDLGWRLAFGLGVVLGLTILIVRRNVPESPRWLFIHGREEEAEAIVDGVESDVREETGEELPEPDDSIKVRQREAIPFREIARTAFKLYPKRAVLGLALFVGQAFIYNGVTFNLGTLFTTFFDVSSAVVPVFIIIYAIGNFLGPVTLGRLFDTIGRKPMIAGTYLGSAAVAVVLAILFAQRDARPVGLRGARRGHVLPGLRRGQRRLPDGQRDLPDGDARAGHRLLLRGGHRGGRHHRPAAVRPPDRQRRARPGGDRLRDRRRR